MKIKKESMKSIPRWLTLCAVPGSCMNIPIYLLLSIPPPSRVLGRMAGA